MGVMIVFVLLPSSAALNLLIGVLYEVVPAMAESGKDKALSNMVRGRLKKTFSNTPILD